MSDLIRVGKPESEWTANDLASYNIQVVSTDEQTFFEETLFEPPDSMNGFLTHLTSADARSAGDEKTAKLLGVLEKAQTGAESWVDEFAARLLKKLGYESGEGRLVKMNEMMWFESGGVRQNTQTDICVFYNEQIVLLVQEDKRTVEGSIVGNEPQLIAEAIAAFASNQRERQVQGASLDSVGMPGILMSGGLPTFYKMVITEELYAAVRANSFPKSPTIVRRFVTPHTGPFGLAMSNLAVRRKVVQYLLTFRKFLDTAQGIYPGAL